MPSFHPILKISIFHFFVYLLSSSVLNAQVTIYFEDFNSYPDGTTIGTNWNAALFNNCDLDVSNGTDFSWGVFGNEFVISDTEGFNCCEINGLPNPAAQFGDNGNTLFFGPIDISAYSSIEVNLDFTTSGDYECAFTDFNNEPCPGADAEPYCQGGHDQAIFSYQVDGGTPVVFGYYCGDNFCYGQPFFCGAVAGSSLNIIITAGTQSDSESYALDNVEVVGYNSSPTATATANGNIGSITLCEGEQLDLDEIGGEASTWNWTGPNSFTDNTQDPSIPNITTAHDGDYVVEIGTPGGCINTSTVTVNVDPAPVASAPPPAIICYSLIPLAGEILNLPDIIDAITSFDPSLTVNWWFDMGASNPLDPTDPGDLFTLISNVQTTVYATVDDGVCESANVVPVSIDLNTYPSANDGSLTECLGSDGMATFNLNDADDQFTGGDPDLTVTYHTSAADATSGDDPVSGMVSVTGTTTYFVRVENTAGCAVEAELELMVEGAITATDASLEVCDDGTGEGEFDLTSVESTVLNGESGTVIFYEDSGLNNVILSPGSYTAMPGFAYAVIDDGMGCLSDPAQITLSLLSFDPDELFLSFDPDNGCGNTTVSVSLNTPAAPFGDYVFDISYGPEAVGPINDEILVGIDGETVFSIDIDEPYVFVLNSVTGPGPLFCEYQFSPPEEYDIMISPAPEAFSASLTVCPNALGEGEFDLTTLEEIINGFSGDPVEFYEDFDLNILINSPGSYISAEATIYAIVDAGGGCVSEPVAIDLFLEAVPDPVNFSLDITDSCNPTDVTLTFSLPTGDTYNIDLLESNSGGTTSTTYSGIANTSMITIPVSETTTFSISEIQSANSGCFFTLSPEPTATITIGAGPTANPASLSGCDDGNGQFLFDLTMANETVNGNTGETVLWFEDADGNMPIGTPGTYTSGNTTVFAAISAGGCTSSTVAVSLVVQDQPDILINIDQDISCAGSSDGEISVAVTAPMPWIFDWSDDSFDGQQSLTNLPAGPYALTLTDGNGCEAFADITLVNPPAVDFTLNAENVSCSGANDGSITVVVNTGTPAFQYDWSDDQYDGMDMLTALPPADYMITVTDMNGCFMEQMVTISEPNALVLDCRANTAGQGSGVGSYTFTYSGGTPFYILDLAGPVNISFTENMPGSWDTAVLPPGNYTFTLTDDNGCVESCSFTISPTCDLTLALDGVNPVCAGASTGSLNLVINSSQAITQIDWNDDTIDGQTNPSGLASGSYTVVVVDAAGCIDSATFVLNDPPAFVIDCSDTSNPTSSMTMDGSVNLMINTGAPPYTINWSGAASGTTTSAAMGAVLIDNLGAGTYNFNVTDNNGCMATCTVVLSGANCDLNLDLQGTHPLCANTATGSLDLMIDSSFPVLSIDWNEDTYDGSGSISNVPAGLFEVTVTDIGGCVASTSLTLVDPPALFISCSQLTQPTTNISTDGAVDVQIAGGIPTYTISWDGPVSGSMNVNTAGTFSITGLSIGPYTVTLEDANGCEEICGFVLTEAGSCSFDLLVQTTDESCPGENDGSASAMPSGGTPNYTYSWSTTEDTPTINNLPPGMYAVTATDSNNCVGIAGFAINAAANLPQLIAGSGAIICADECYQLPLEFEGQAPFVVDYTLNSGGMMTNMQATFNSLQDSIEICPANMGLTAGAFSLGFSQVTDANCQTTLNQVVNFEYLAPANSNLAPTICTTDSLMVGDSIFHFNNPMGAVVLENASADGCDSTVNVSLSFFPESVTTLSPTICLEDSLMVGDSIFHFNHPTGTVVLEDASSNGCDSTITVDLSFFPESVTALSPTICPDDSLMVGDSIFHFNHPTGTVVLEDASINGCDSTITVDLSFFPISELLVESSICPGDTLTYGGQDFFIGNTSDTIVLADASANGCDSTIMVNLTPLSVGTEQITGDLCAGESLTIAGVVFDETFLADTILLAGAAANGCDSLIEVNLNLIPLLPTPLMPFLCPGDSITVGDTTLFTAGLYDILLEDAAANGCDSLISVDLNFFSAAEGTFEGTYCAGEQVMVGDSVFNLQNNSGTVILEGAADGGCDSTVVVNLNFLPGTINSLDTLLCFGEAITIGDQTFDSSSPTGIVVLDNAAANGCDSTIFVTTNYRPELFASLGPDTTLCGNQTVDGVLELSPGAIYDFEILSSSGFTLSLEDINPGTFTFGLGTINSDITLSIPTITSSSGCAVTVLDEEALIRYSNSQLSLNSVGGNGGMDISCGDAGDGSIVTNISDGIGPFQYNWSTGDTTANLDNLGPGTYTLTLTDAPGCAVESSITLTAPPPLQAVAYGESAGCFGTTTGSIIIEEIAGGTGPYEYSLDNEFFISLANFPLSVPNLAAGSYTLYLQDANDCQTNVTVGVPEGQLLQMELGDNQIIKAGDSILLDPQIDFIPNSWSWTPTEGLSQPDTFVTYAAPLETTVYQLVMSDINGCSVSDIIRIIVERDINVFIPSAFSPDGDGRNDLFMIFAGQGVAQIERFQVFDRWGNQVFLAGPYAPNDPLRGWDGTHNGQLLNAAVFVYFAEVTLITGETVMLEGEVILLK